MKMTLLTRIICLMLCLSGTLQAQNSPPAHGTLTGEWVIQFVPGTDADSAAARLNMDIVERVASLPDTYLLRPTGENISVGIERAWHAMPLQELPEGSGVRLNGSGEIIFASPQRWLDVEFYAPPDPLYPQQWHLNNTGQSGGTPGQDIRAEGAWNAGFDGTGVVVAIVDNGIEHTHPDLAPNYLPAFSQDFAGGDFDPMPDFPTEGHGTAVAGLAVGADDGAACGSGVAYNAGLSGIRFATPISDVSAANFLNVAPADNDIYSNSWGFVNGATVGPAFLPATLATFQNNTLTGRGGPGNIYVFPAGNGRAVQENAGRSAFLTSRYVIVAGATDDNGVQASYSEPGSALLVNAPGGSGNMVTTDMQGVAGFTPTDCNLTFTGTSAAVPVVAGTAALVLQVNPALTWRDVQYVLTETADQNDPGNPGWFTSSAGYRFNTAYGFGRVNASAATQFAASWQTAPAEAPLLISGVQAVAQPIPDNSPATPLEVTFDFTLPVSQHMVIEHVEVRVDIVHPRYGDVAARLISPAGTAVDLMTPRPNATTPAPFNYEDFAWLSAAHRGESPLGRWTLQLTDNRIGQTGTLATWELRITGIPALSNDLFMNARDIGTLDTPYFESVRALQSTRETFDPIPSCSAGVAYRTLWYRYTPSQDTAVKLSTQGSLYNTVISVWTGTPGGGFTEVGCDNDGGGSITSLLANLPVSAGVTYYILVSADNRFYNTLNFQAEIGLPVAAAAPPGAPAPTETPVIEAAPDLLAQVTLLPATGEIPLWSYILRGGMALVLFGGLVKWLRHR